MNNFLVVGTQRTGSTALAEGIGLHPEIACGREWAHGKTLWRRVAAIRSGLHGDFSCLTKRHQDYMDRIFVGSEKWLGCRLLFGAPFVWLVHPALSPRMILDSLELSIRWMRSETTLHVIHIVRENHLDWVKSCFLASVSNSYWGKPYAEDLRVTIPIKRALRGIRAKIWIDKRLSSLQHSIPYKKIRYEEFLDNNSMTIDRVVAFLGCGPSEGLSTSTPIKKQSTKAADSYIENYDEFLSAIRGSGLE